MTEETIMVDSYTFWNFKLDKASNTLSFCVGFLGGRDLRDEDKQTVEDMLNDLGKWETLVRTGLHLLSDLRIRQIEQATIQNYDKPLGTGIYKYTVEKADIDRLDCSIHIKKEERERRNQLKIEPIFSVKEITNQLNNVPKWKAFQKTISIVKDICVKDEVHNS